MAKGVGSADGLEFWSSWRRGFWMKATAAEVPFQSDLDVGQVARRGSRAVDAEFLPAVPATGYTAGLRGRGPGGTAIAFHHEIPNISSYCSGSWKLGYTHA